MSIPVELHDLREAAAGFEFAYLLTVSDDLRPHAVAVTPAFAGATMTVSTGRRTVANATARPKVSLVYPPAEPGGYSLIVDADASTDGSTVVLAATNAVLHRPAPGPETAEPGSCGSDCISVPLGE